MPFLVSPLALTIASFAAFTLFIAAVGIPKLLAPSNCAARWTATPLSTVTLRANGDSSAALRQAAAAQPEDAFVERGSQTEIIACWHRYGRLRAAPTPLK